jgi:hypothetical protein
MSRRGEFLLNSNIVIRCRKSRLPHRGALVGSRCLRLIDKACLIADVNVPPVTGVKVFSDATRSLFVTAMIHPLPRCQRLDDPAYPQNEIMELNGRGFAPLAAVLSFPACDRATIVCINDDSITAIEQQRESEAWPSTGDVRLSALCLAVSGLCLRVDLL